MYCQSNLILKRLISFLKSLSFIPSKDAASFIVRQAERA